MKNTNRIKILQSFTSAVVRGNDTKSILTKVENWRNCWTIIFETIDNQYICRVNGTWDLEASKWIVTIAQGMPMLTSLKKYWGAVESYGLGVMKSAQLARLIDVNQSDL